VLSQGLSDALRHLGRLGIGIDHDAARGVFRRDLPIGIAQAFMERQTLSLEPVSRILAAPLIRPLQAE
jgi:hypothetical protein